MSLPNTLWSIVLNLPVPGFNPTPYRHHGQTWAIYRKKQGSYAQQLTEQLTDTIGPEYPISAHLDDCRIVPSTHPALMTAAIYNQPTRQTLTFLHIDADHARLLTPAHPLRLDNGPASTRTRPQKNWQPFLTDDRRLTIVYDAQPFTIATPTDQPNTWHIAHRMPWTLPPWAAQTERTPRMSTAPLYLPDGRLLWLWHIKDKQSGYWTGANLSDPEFPYTPTHTTAQPLLRPEDAADVSPHWPPNRCIFPMTALLQPPNIIELWAGDSDRSAIVLYAPLPKILERMENLT